MKTVRLLQELVHHLRRLGVLDGYQLVYLVVFQVIADRLARFAKLSPVWHEDEMYVTRWRHDVVDDGDIGPRGVDSSPLVQQISHRLPAVKNHGLVARS